MKKFLSLLLALTMVMSLVIVPARAHDGPSVGGDLSITATDTTRGATSPLRLLVIRQLRGKAEPLLSLILLTVGTLAPILVVQPARKAQRMR